MITCIYCFKEFDAPGKACKNSNCEADLVTVSRCREISGLSDLHVPNLFINITGSDGVSFEACPRCKNRTAYVYVCPNCRSVVREEFANSEVFTVALAGSRNAGKTVYMVSLINSLRSMCHRKGVSITGLYGTDNHFSENYEKVMYENEQVLMATPKDRQRDLIYRVGEPSRGPIIIIRDVAGETLQEVSGGMGSNPSLDYVNNANLVAFMFDPYTVNQLMDILNGVVEADNVQSMQGEVLLNILLNSVINMQSSQARLALIFSKFDVIQALRDFGGTSALAWLLANPGISFLLDDSRLPNYQWDYEDALILDADVRSLFSQPQFGAQALMHNIEAAYHSAGRPQDLCTFAVSSLGNAPSGDSLSTRGISPFRCLDPLQWGFYRKYGCPLIA